MSTMRFLIKILFKGSYDKQNLTLMVISYEIYETRRRLVSYISYEMTTRVRSSIFIFQVLHHRRKKFHQIHVSLRDEDKNFLYVWFLLYILRMWGTIRFFLYVFRNPSEKEWYMKGLLRLQAFGDPGQAFCNFFLFCLLDKTVRTKLRHSLCCKTSKGSEDSNLLLPDHDDGNSVENINGDIHGYGSVSTTGSFRQFLSSSYSKPNRLC